MPSTGDDRLGGTRHSKTLPGGCLSAVKEAQIAASDLVPVLEEWCRPFSDYHLYYPIEGVAYPAVHSAVE